MLELQFSQHPSQFPSFRKASLMPTVSSITFLLSFSLFLSYFFTESLWLGWVRNGKRSTAPFKCLNCFCFSAYCCGCYIEKTLLRNCGRKAKIWRTPQAKTKVHFGSTKVKFSEQRNCPLPHNWNSICPVPDKINGAFISNEFHCCMPTIIHNKWLL